MEELPLVSKIIVMWGKLFQKADYILPLRNYLAPLLQLLVSAYIGRKPKIQYFSIKEDPIFRRVPTSR
jgi:hypothetical protein